MPSLRRPLPRHGLGSVQGFSWTVVWASATGNPAARMAAARWLPLMLIR